MSSATTIDRFFKRYPAVAVTLYVTLVSALLAATFAAVADVLDHRASVRAASDLLAQFEGRRSPAGAGDSNSIGPVPAGSPFLEGDTVTVAGAALLQRVATAITRVGGNVLSSQVELQGPQAAEGYVSLVASCEVEQPALQRLVYDLEAGMPFLFIEQLVIQAPQSATPDSGRMRVLISVSGQWQGHK